VDFNCSGRFLACRILEGAAKHATFKVREATRFLFSNQAKRDALLTSGCRGDPKSIGEILKSD
jgi:hypothetical protein